MNQIQLGDGPVMVVVHWLGIGMSPANMRSECQSDAWTSSVRCNLTECWSTLNEYSAAREGRSVSHVAIACGDTTKHRGTIPEALQMPDISRSMLSTPSPDWMQPLQGKAEGLAGTRKQRCWHANPQPQPTSCLDRRHANIGGIERTIDLEMLCIICGERAHHGCLSKQTQ